MTISTKRTSFRLSLIFLVVFFYALVSFSGFPQLQNFVRVTKTSGNSSHPSDKENIPRNKTSFNKTHSQIRNPAWHGDRLRGDDFVSLALSGDQAIRFPTVSYFVFADRITFSVTHAGENYEYGRKRPMEELYLKALDHLQHTQTGWPLLRSILQNGSLPFVVDYADVAGCYGNIMKLGNNSTLGVFTMAMPTDPRCPIRLTLPNYYTVDAMRSVENIARDNKDAPSWHNKINKAVWRGTLNNGRHRWKLVETAVRNPSLLDAGFFAKQGNFDGTSLDPVGGFAQWMERKEFSKYKAVLDVDGNSWSGRFGHLLCMDSVVIKISPQDIDYFWSELVPYKHYLPVDENMTNLLDQVHWVMNEPNRSQEIVANANAWCRAKLRLEVLVHDLLDIWDAYASMVVPPTSNEEIYKLPNLNTVA